jgi:hypothetical protein
LHEEKKSRATGRSAKIKSAKALILGETQKSRFAFRRFVEPGMARAKLSINQKKV